MPAKTQGVSDREIVIAQDGENAKGCCQSPQHARHRGYMLEPLVHEIPGQNNEVGILGLGQGRRLGQIGSGNLMAAVKVR